jgi:membrane protein
MRTHKWLTTVRVVLRVARSYHLSSLAGSLAYRTFLSLLPIVLLVWIVSATLAGEVVTAQLIEWTRQYLSPSGQAVMVQAVLTARTKPSGSLFGVTVLVWSVVRIVWEVDTVFGRLYDQPAGKSLVRQVRDGLIGLLALSVAIAAMIAAGLFVTLVARLPLLDVLTPVLLLIGLTIVFLPLYYIFPPIPVTLREIIPGAAVAAIGWALLHGLFQVYAAVTSLEAMYGVIGSVLLVLLWMYAGAFLLLLGIVVNVVLAGRSEAAVDGPTPGRGLIQRTRALLDRSSD